MFNRNAIVRAISQLRSGAFSLRAQLMVVALFILPVNAALAAPAIYYTDLDSAPVNAWVTIYGSGFGSSQGSGSVILGGSATLSVVTWSDTKIEAKLPSGAGSGLTVVNGSGTSNSITFTARTTGRILFADPVNGSNSYDGTSATFQGGTKGPWKDQGSNANSSNPGPVSAGFYALNPGDVLYLRGGSYPNATNTYGGKTWLFIDGERGGVKANVGSSGLPIAMVSYPGELAEAGSDTFGVGIMPYGNIHDITIAKIRLHSGSAAMSMNETQNARLRIVDIETAGPMNDEYNAFGFVGTDGLKVLGNKIHDVGKAGEKLSHAIYYEGYGTSTDVEIAYNTIVNERGGRGIQVYAHTATDRVDVLNIHDNYVDTTTLTGILVGQGDGNAPANWVRTANIVNNVVRRSGNPNGYSSNAYLPEQSAIHLTLSGCDFFVSHNTLVGDNVYHTLWLEASKTAVIRDNLFDTKSVVVGSGAAGVTWDHNGFAGGLSSLLGAIGSIVSASAGYVGGGDFTLSSSSPFKGKASDGSDIGIVSPVLAGSGAPAPPPQKKPSAPVVTVP
jgi:hypothetical protein